MTPRRNSAGPAPAAAVPLAALFLGDAGFLVADLVHGVGGAAIALQVLRLGWCALAFLLVTRRTPVPHEPVVFAAVVANVATAVILAEARGLPSAVWVASLAVVLGAAVSFPWGARWQAAAAASAAALLSTGIGFDPSVPGGAVVAAYTMVALLASVRVSSIVTGAVRSMESGLAAEEDAAQRTEGIARELGRTVHERTEELRSEAALLEQLCLAAAHDLRPPLRTLGSFAQILRELVASAGRPASARVLDDVARAARDSASRVDSLLSDVRALQARVGSDLFSVLDIVTEQKLALEALAPSCRWSMDVPSLVRPAGEALAEAMRHLLRHVVVSGTGSGLAEIDVRGDEDAVVVRAVGWRPSEEEHATLSEVLRGSIPAARVPADLQPLVDAVRLMARSGASRTRVSRDEGGAPVFRFFAARSDGWVEAPTAASDTVAEAPASTQVVRPARAAALLDIAIGAAAAGTVADTLTGAGGASHAALVWTQVLGFSVGGTLRLLLSRMVDENRVVAVTVTGLVTCMTGAVTASILRGESESLALVCGTFPIVASTFVRWGPRLDLIPIALSILSLASLEVFAPELALPGRRVTLTVVLFAISVWISRRLATTEAEVARSRVSLAISRQSIELLNAETGRLLAERTNALENVSARLGEFCRSLATALEPEAERLALDLAAVREELRDLENAEAHEHLERLEAATVRVKETLALLLDYASLSGRPLERETVDVSALASAWIEAKRSRPGEAARRARLHVEVQPGLLVEGDRALVAETIASLLDNAWRAAARRDSDGKAAARHDGDGKAAARRDSDGKAAARHDGDGEAAAGPGRVEVRGEASEDGTTIIVVRDDGPGFDEIQARKLFRPFTRLEGAGSIGGSGSESGGRGMGLARVARIAARHGGRAEARSTPGEGTEFRVSFPGTRTSPTQGAPRPASVFGGNGSTSSQVSGFASTEGPR